MFFKHTLKLILTMSLMAFVPSFSFAGNGNGNGNSNGNGNNNGNGGGSNSGAGGSNGNGGSSGNPFDCDRNPNLCTGNSGNGNGNTGPGNQGNDKPVGNAGGNNGGGNNGGGNNGGGNNGGGNNGGGNNGGGNNGGGNNGGGNNGGGNNGGGNNGGGDNGGGDNGGGDNGGGSDNGGNNGGSDNGGSDNGSGNGGDQGGNDQGDNGQKDDSKNDDGKKDQTPAQQKEEKKKKELKAKLLPAFYLDFDSGNKIINTTSHDSRKADNNLVKSDFNAANDTLVYGDYASGFQVTNYSRLEGGIGANVGFYFANATGLQNALWATIGLIPYSGRELVSNRYASSLKAAHEKPSLSIPLSADIVDTWAVGDNTTHASKGGIIFFAGPGVGPASLSVSYVANGIYQVYVEKVDAENVLVRLTDINVDRVSVQAGLTLTSVGVTKYKEVAKAFSYLINFKDPVGAKAYSDLVRGNVAAVQKLATQGVSSVQKWEQMTRTQVGRINHFFFGFPIVLNTVWTAGKVYEISNTQTLFDDTLTTVQYGIYLKDRRSRLITTHSSVTQAFYGGVVKIQPKNSTATKAYFGQYTWTAEDDSTSHRDIRSDIKGLIQKTGMKKELTLNIPTFKDLEYSQVSFKMNLNEDTTLSLIKTLTKSSEQNIAALAEKKAQAYFSGSGQSDAWELCAIQQERFDSCMTAQIAEARSNGKQLYKAAVNMKAAYTAGQDKEFTTAYADFGKALLSSPFVFQAFLQVAGEGIEMEYLVNNTYFSSYHMKFTTTATPGTYTKSLVPTFAFSPNFPIESGATRGGAVVPPGMSPIVSP